MSNKNKKILYISDESRKREYNKKSLAELKRIGKKQDLLNVDQYKKTDKNILIERLVKGKQIKDESKGILLEQAKNTGLKVNANMSKEDILLKISNPKLTDLNNKRLRELADKGGIPLRSQMTDRAIIQRLENPTDYYTVESLKRLARNNNIDVRRNISKPDLINLLGERNLITTTPIKAQESNLWVEFKNIPEALRKVVKKKARNAREKAADFQQYIKNINKDHLTPARLKKLSKQLEKKIKAAAEEHKRIFTPTEGKSAFKNFTTRYVIKGDPTYDPKTFLEEAKPAMVSIMNSNRNIKAKLYLNCIMKRTDSDGFTAEKDFAFHSIGDKIITEETDPHEIYQEMSDEIEEEIRKIETAVGSGWIFVKIIDQNLDISISILGYNAYEKVYPLKISDYTKAIKKEERRKYDIVLLLLKDGENSHYCLVKNISALLTIQLNKRKSKFYYYLNCLNGYDEEEKLDKHKEYCSEKECIKINMPPKGTYLQFNKFSNTEKAPFAIYADFESLIKPLKSCDPNPNQSYTNKHQIHKPISFTYYIKSFDESVYKSKIEKYIQEKEEGPDAAFEFVKRLEEDVRKIAELGNKEIEITDKEEKEFNNALECWICGGFLGVDRVRDHCHYTGRYRGPAHNKCNLNYRKENNISVFFHNLAGYDSHLFIKKLGYTEGNIDCIPTNEEKYISFTKTIKAGTYTNKKGEIKNKSFKIIFKDTYKFLAASLDVLVSNTPKHDFKILDNEYPPEQAELLKQKGFYPYEYMDSVEKFKDKKLAPQKAFYSKLTGKGISNKNYKHACNVWNIFNMETMKDYHELYNDSDVLLLADVFENFRDLCLKIYGLDPVHYYTAPGLAWDACLKITGEQLELLHDENMLLMFEKGIRGGISIISNRYGEANNKYMKGFNKNKPSKYLMYLDANNLYGWAMSQKLPTHGFKWLTSGEMGKLFKNQVVQVWEKIPCILEVDLEYPKESHDLHNDYPLCPERVKCDKGVEKLIPNLRDKTKYVIHYKNLMQCLQQGMKLKKIHRGIKFVESEWMKPYIEKNTYLRSQTKNNFEKDFFKLMNNSVFGKTMENIRNRVNVKLVTSKEQLRKLAAKPNFKGPPKIFNENLISVHMKKTSLTMNKPVYLGMCILDLSKTLMYDFHYNYIKPKYGDKAKLLFTDTDSFLYEIQTEDFYKDISGDVKNRFDTSDYPENHPSGISTGINKKVLGMFKDEVAGKNIKEFVGLRSKLYSFIMEEGKENKKCKGVKRQVVENNITHEDYKTCLTTGKEKLVKQNIIRSYTHETFTEEVNKIALSAEDDKRYILKDGIHTLAWGHYKIPDN